MSVFELHGRKALVTGGARGLGAGMAEALARAGAAVAVADIREDIGKATADALDQAGVTARFVPLNVTNGRAGTQRARGRSTNSAAWIPWWTTPGATPLNWS